MSMSKAIKKGKKGKTVIRNEKVKRNVLIC